MPTVQGSDNFDHAIDAGYYTDGFFSPGAGNPEAVISPLYRSQAKSLHITTGAGNSGVRHNVSGSPTRGWAGFAFQCSSLLPEGQEVTVAGFSSAATDAGRISLGSTGLYLNNSGGSAVEFAISSGTWYWVEMIFDVSGTSHNVYGRIGGVDMTAPTAFSAGSASTVDFHQLLSLADDSGTVSDYYSLWEWGQATSNADWLGEPGAVVAVSFMSGVGW